VSPPKEKLFRSEGSKTVTIDGPAGAGKSTVSKILAKRLNYMYLDTGAMYRAVALRVKEEGIDPTEETALERLCRKLEICFQENNKQQRIICQGKDVTEKIREPAIGFLASTVSMKRPVREAMVRMQRKIGEKGGIVAEGRDTGTVVFPAAEYKFFLVADPEERARRRHRELLAKGLSISLEEVIQEVTKRDEQDTSRELAPLRPAAEAWIIDSTGRTPAEVAERMLKIIKKNPRGMTQSLSDPA